MDMSNFTLEELEVIRELIKEELDTIDSEIGDPENGQIPEDKLTLVPYQWILRDIFQKIDRYTGE
jgi:hypothetical protein